MRARERVYASRFTPNVKGSQIDWQIGERARFVSSAHPPHSKSGEIVTIQSEHTYNYNTPEGQFFRECVFDGETKRVPIMEDSLYLIEVSA